MNDQFIESRKAISNAREALKKGAMTEARQWAERAAELAPQNEDPWLLLAAMVGPRESMEYLRKALKANPNSPRAKQGMELATQKLGETPKARVSSKEGKQTQSGTRSGDSKNLKKRSSILPILLIVMGCAVFIFAAWSAARSPVLASILNISSKPQAQTRPPFAQVNIAKPAIAAQGIMPTVTLTAAIQESQAEVVSIPPTTAPTIESFTLPTDAPFIPLVVTQPEVTSEPGTIQAEIIADTPTPEFVEPTVGPTVAPYAAPQAVGNGEHWIDVDLSQQRLYAYAGDTLMNSFLVSTGTWQTPTVTGAFHIWVKLRSTTMTGPGYYLPDVPFTMYFYKDYGLHGTYWHNNFGTPMSHGCVNLATPDAEWLYNFSSVGTLVNVHY